MKIAQRKSTNPIALRRELLLSERNRSAALRRVYPNLAQLQIELTFNDQSSHRPSPQRYTLYPAAPAFFRFACPCADCDADFDLRAIVATLLTSTSDRAATASGQLHCHGVRLRDRVGSNACSMEVQFQLEALHVEQPG